MSARLTKPSAFCDALSRCRPLAFRRECAGRRLIIAPTKPMDAWATAADRSNPGERMNRYGRWSMSLGRKYFLRQIERARYRSRADHRRRVCPGENIGRTFSIRISTSRARLMDRMRVIAACAASISPASFAERGARRDARSAQSVGVIERLRSPNVAAARRFSNRRSMAASQQMPTGHFDLARLMFGFAMAE